MGHRQSVYFSDRAMESLDKRPKAVQLTTRVNEVIVRYGELMDEARVVALEKLTTDEQAVIRKLLAPIALDNRTAAEVEELLLLLAREAVIADAQLGELLAKLTGMHRVERLALSEWVQLAEGSIERQVVHQVLQLGPEQHQELLDWIAKQGGGDTSSSPR